jgi:class 3 adenylate cyclase
MTVSYPDPPPRCLAPQLPGGGPAFALVWRRGTPTEQRCVFYDQIEIGRDDGSCDVAPGLMLIADQAISRRHCVVRQAADGRCFARDVSRNGTRLDGRRMVPNVEVEVRSGQTLTVGTGVELVLEASGVATSLPGAEAVGRTVGIAASSIATVLVGDIRDYTTLVRRAPAAELQKSINHVFEILNGTVGEHQGTVKEYQGDAILAFWEGNVSGTQAIAACRAALALDRVARAVASDASAWQLPDFPLEMDWALATGLVLLDSFGGVQPTGLSLIGEPVVLAFRLEKFATPETGRILTCRVTRDMACGTFTFRDLGRIQAKGFDQPDQVFALEDERRPDQTT